MYEPLGIYIGAARYEEDIFKSFKKDMQKLLINTRYGEAGYVFAFNYNGDIVSHVTKSKIGTNKDSAKPKGRKLIESIIEGAKLSEEGFFISYTATLNPNTGKSARKTSFIKSVPAFKWAIGTGIYDEDVSEQIVKRHQILKKDLNKTISNIVYFATAFLLVILLLEIVIFYKLTKVIQNYQDKLNYNIKHDFLTALPNRRLFGDRLNQAIKHSKRDKTELAVMFIDVDNFKKINDNLGHDIGDEVLQKIALLLEESIRESDVVARQGGDEFIVLINDSKSRNDIMLVADKIQKTMHSPVCMNGICHDITLSIGISIFPHDGEDEKTLLRHADIAMYKAKADGRDRYNFFN
jgi:diguanylate cyclase (GGDEF)-like protein